LALGELENRRDSEDVGMDPASAAVGSCGDCMSGIVVDEERRRALESEEIIYYKIVDTGTGILFKDATSLNKKNTVLYVKQ
jgi:hypothetical protein